MKRRIVLLTCTLGVLGGGAGAAFAGPVDPPKAHELCVVLVSNKDHQHTQDYCINWYKAS
jgi:hypothetical protein